MRNFRHPPDFEYGTLDERFLMNAGSEKSPTTTWPEVAEGLYAFLTGRGATIEYTFDNMEVWVPSTAHENSPAAKWKVNGTLRVRTSEKT